MSRLLDEQKRGATLEDSRLAARPVGRPRRHRCAGARTPAPLAPVDRAASSTLPELSLSPVHRRRLPGCGTSARSTLPAIPGPVEVFAVAATDTVVDPVSDRLQARGLIANARVFRYYVDHNGGLRK